MNKLLKLASVTTALITAVALSAPSFAAPPVEGGPGAARQIENTKCRQTLIDAAVEQVNRPALTALHTGKGLRNLVARR